MSRRKIFFDKGQKIYDWTILGEGGIGKWRRILYLVKCKCGLVKKVAACELNKGHTKSCHPCSMKTYKEKIKLMAPKPNIKKQDDAQYFVGSWEN